MSLISKDEMIDSLHLSNLDKPMALSPGLKKVLAIKSGRLSRLVVMQKFLGRLHFLRLHNVLGPKNYRIPPKWQMDLNYQEDLASAVDLLEIISKNLS